jgi:hypothetical protein
MLRIKDLLALSFVWSSFALAADAPASTLKEAWTLTADIDAPESVYYDEGSGFPDAKDGKGWIQKVSLDGKVAAAKWVDGLNAPKGMRSHAGKLWVSNIDELISIDIATGKIASRLKIAGAKFLNDVAVDGKGTVYVSDTLTNKIHAVKKGKASTFVSGDTLESPNGLLFENGSLLVATWGPGRGADWSTKSPGSLYRVDMKTKKLDKVAPPTIGNLDGLEAAPGGGYYVSDWLAGKVFQIDPKGGVREILSGLKGSADIGFVVSKQHLIVPRMNENKVTAYETAAAGR